MKPSFNMLPAAVVGTILLAAAFSVVFANNAMAYPQGSAAGYNDSTMTSGTDHQGGMMDGNNTTTSGNSNSSMMMAHSNGGNAHMSDLFSFFNQNFLVGAISGVQGSTTGGQQPEWVLSGQWVMTFEPSNATGSSGNNTTASSTGTASSTIENGTSNSNTSSDMATGNWNSTSNNSTTTSEAKNDKFGISNNTSLSDFSSMFGTTTAIKDIANVTGFDALIVMVKPDGSALHTHTISNFTQTQNVTTQGNTTTVTGTSTVTLREGPVNDVPTTIALSNNGTVMALSFDEPSVNDHFGDSPIYGIGVTKELIQAHIEQEQQLHGGMNNTMTSGMTNNGQMPSLEDHSNSTTTSSNNMLDDGSGMK